MQKDQLRDNCLYFDITKQERDSAIRFLLSSIIKCRQDSNFPSNYYTFDEDVNVYLAHLLFAVSLPEYHEMAEPYLSTNTSDILKWVKATDDRTIRYFIFKVNADHLLLHTAIFDDLRQPKMFKPSGRHFLELARLYYDQAAMYHTKIYRKKTGVGEVLQKLAQYFEAYQTLLKTVRREYFGFVTSFRDQAFHSFMDQVKSYEEECVRKTKMDRFLEVYGRWLDSKDPALEAQLRDIINDLRKLDPQFDFNFDRHRQYGGMRDDRECA